MNRFFCFESLSSGKSEMKTAYWIGDRDLRLTSQELQPGLHLHFLEARAASFQIRI